MEIEMAKIEKFRLEKAIEQNHQKWYRLEIFREDTFESLEGAVLYATQFQNPNSRLKPGNKI